MDLREIRTHIKAALDEDISLVALLIRFAWHASGTYDKHLRNGGSNGGTMRFKNERNDPENAGFERAYELYDTIKQTQPDAENLSFADLYILGGYVAIEHSDGPKIPFRTGRIDHSSNEATEIYGKTGCPFGDGAFNPNGSRLPAADLGTDENATKKSDKEKRTADAMRKTFSRMGFDDKETVALMLLGHQYGGGHLDVSGYEGFWYGLVPYKWNITPGFNFGFLSVYKNLGIFNEVVNPAGNRQYETTRFGPKFLMLPVDMALAWDPGYKVHLKFYKKNKEDFRADAIRAWVKLTELGCEGILTNELDYSK